MASIGDIHDLNRLPPDDAGRTPAVLYGAGGEALSRIPSLPTDEQGAIPVRSKLAEVLTKIGAIPTKTADVPLQDSGLVAAALVAQDGSDIDVPDLISGLASTLATLRQEHETLQGEHTQLIEQLGQVLDAVGQVLDAVGEISTEQSGGWQETEWDTQDFSGQVVIAEAGHIEFSVEFPFIHELNAVELALQVSMRVHIDADQRFWMYPRPSSNGTFAVAPETRRSIEAEFNPSSSSLDTYYRPVFKATRWAGGRADNTDEIRFYGTFKGDPGGATATISERRARFLYKPAPPL